MYVEWSEAELRSASPRAPQPTLSPLFGLLIFGLGPAALPFHHTYLQYLRITSAMEHILLAFVRWARCTKLKQRVGQFIWRQTW
jgi:hypothetical protein